MRLTSLTPTRLGVKLLILSVVTLLPLPPNTIIATPILLPPFTSHIHSYTGRMGVPPLTEATHNDWTHHYLFRSPIPASRHEFPSRSPRIHSSTYPSLAWRSGQPQPALVPHNPILINSDADFTAQAAAEGWPGDGSPTNPYLIENLHIDLNGATGSCIDIRNTSVHFIIRGCLLQDATHGVGIRLYNVTNGKLVNNTCINNFYGINLDYNSSSITLSNNTCSSNHYGIRLYFGCYNTVANNTCTNHRGGICLAFGCHNTVANNTCTTNNGYGIRLYGSHSNIIVNNSMAGCGLLLWGDTLDGSRQTLVSGNTVNGKPLIFWQDQVGGTIPSSAGQVVLVNCSRITIRGLTLASCTVSILLSWSGSNTVSSNTCANNSWYGIVFYGGGSNLIVNNTCTNNFFAGIHLDYGCFNNTVSTNTCTNNEWYGISLKACHGNIVVNNTCTNNGYGGIRVEFECGNNTVSGNTCTANDGEGIGVWDESRENLLINNTCTNNDYGIRLQESCQDNTINGNTCTDNNDYGIYIGSGCKNNSILWNILEDNTANAYDEGMDNIFDYNYWSDYTGPDSNGDGIGDTPHPIPGPAGNTDPHPLIILRWAEPPTNQIAELGTPFRYDLNVTSYDKIDQWWIDDTHHFAIDDGGVITNATPLPVGRYRLQVWVNDTHGRLLTATFTVRVQDTTPPIWVVAPTDQTLAYGQELELQLEAWDLSGIHHWAINDTTHFNITSTGHLTSIGSLAPGKYGLNVTVSDPYDNTISATFTITIEKATQTPGPPPILGAALAAAGITGVTAALAAALITRRKRRT